MKHKISSFKKISQIDKPQPQSNQEKKRKEIFNIKHVRSDIITDSTNGRRTLRKYLNKFMPVNSTSQTKWMN